MTIEELQTKIYEAIQRASVLSEVGSRTVDRNPAFDWKGGDNPPGIPEYLFGKYTREDFEVGCKLMKDLIKDVPDKYLGPNLRNLKRGQYSSTHWEIKDELDDALKGVHYPGRIKDMDADFIFQDYKLKVIFWPEGQVESHFRVPPYTEYLTRWPYFLKNMDDNIFMQFQIVGHWDYQNEQMIFNWQLSEANELETAKLASKEIFKISAPVFDVLAKTSELKVSLVKDDPSKFIKIVIKYSKY
jgi:hypothetical protein